MMKVKPTATRRKILVTGSRGKSTVVRLLHTALQDAGLHAFARITGVVPRELNPAGVRSISRSSGAHVEEMRWWLRRLPHRAQAVILENSAIAIDLQELAGRWLRPDVTVLTNVLPDHQEAWGPGRDDAARVLCAGVPEYGTIILPVGLKTDNYLLELLRRRSCRLVFSEPAREAAEGFRATNLGLALTVIEQLGLSRAPALQAMLGMPPDRYDFQLKRWAGAEVAMAFSANDITSTQTLFRSLCWSEQETRLLYNHRRDRPERLNSFADWLDHSDWSEVLIIGDKPRRRPTSAQYLAIRNEAELRQLFRPGGRYFGCGNIAGLPLSLAQCLE